MRTFVHTLVLAVAAVSMCGLAGWQWRQGNFDAWFGAPPTPVGERIYTSWRADQVKHIRISDHSSTATFSLGGNGWQMSAPWEDRMDPRAAVAVINFTLGLRVEDFTHEDRIDAAKAGLNGSAITIRLEDANHGSLAKYKLGRVTPWKAEVENVDGLVSTVYVQPRDKHHRSYVYSCTGDITSLFKDNLKFLRDHRPFYFNPLMLAKLRIRSQQGDLTLGRESPTSPWRIVKPLDLATDAAAMKSLLEGLYELQALRVLDRSSVTLPATDSAVKTQQIAIAPFGAERETVLEIYPLESPDAQVAKATASDRPNSVFELPVKPEAGVVSLADLPLEVNQLRDPTLTHLNIQSLRAIAIQPSTGAEIIISREPSSPWMACVGEQVMRANEENLYRLLKALTTHRVAGFESDAATEFAAWGLDRPFLTLRLLGSDNQALELRFGMDGQGGIFVNRLGTPTVMRVDESLLAAIAVRAFEWRHARLPSPDRVNLSAIERKTGGESLLLRYDFLNESWQGEANGQDVTATLDAAKCNFLLAVLEDLKVTRWLAKDDEGATAALAQPTLTLTVVERTYDAEGAFAGLTQRTLTLAPANSGAQPAYYYGRLSSEPQPFLLDRASCQKLAAGLGE